MPVNQDYEGRTFPATEPYEVSRVKIADFAEAIGDFALAYSELTDADHAAFIASLA